MPKNMMSRNRNILLRGYEHITSVPYDVTLRWVFYRLYQEGLYTTKDDYTQFKILSAKARHNNLCSWHPKCLVDDTRRMYLYGFGDDDELDAINNIKCNLDKISTQDTTVMILFEAKAMFSQFKHYTSYIPLIPFGGDPSIPYKYSIAETIDYFAERYDKPIQLLYFGDYDDKGLQIFKTAIKHIRKWCNVDFNVKHCGLTFEHVQQYELPMSVKGHGYQWEALSDQQASEIITIHVSKYQNLDVIASIEKKEKTILEKWKNLLKNKKET